MGPQSVTDQYLTWYQAHQDPKLWPIHFSWVAQAAKCWKNYCNFNLFSISWPVQHKQMCLFPSCFCKKRKTLGHIRQSEWAEMLWHRIRNGKLFWASFGLFNFFERLHVYDFKIYNSNMYYKFSLSLELSSSLYCVQMEKSFLCSMGFWPQLL